MEVTKGMPLPEVPKVSQSRRSGGIPGRETSPAIRTKGRMAKRGPSEYKTYLAWGIESRGSGPLPYTSTLIGPYFLDGETPQKMEGHRAIAFKTRAEARASCPKPWAVGEDRRWYVPVRIKVTVERAQ